MARITRERAYEVLRLDVETGILTWRVSNCHGGHRKAGERAGYLHTASGYRYVKVDGIVYREHVLIWFMVYGEWLPRKIDHHDLNRSNNAPGNLRKATESEQRSNAKLRTDNALGERGVTFHRASGLFVAEVRHGSKRVVKYFHSKHEAAAAARQLRLEMFGQFAPVYDRGAP